MSEKSKYKYIPLAVVVLVGFGMAVLSRYIALEQNIDMGTANLIFIGVIACIIIGYLLFMVLWEPLFLKFFGKLLTPKTTKTFTPDRPELPESEFKDKVDAFCRHSDEILKGYVADEDMQILHIYIQQYAEGEMGNIPNRTKTVGVDNFDLYHYGWNIWNHFQVADQPETADWLIAAFELLKDSNRNIYKKFKHNERATYKIPIEYNIK